jgi:hypothetical protein
MRQVSSGNPNPSRIYKGLKIRRDEKAVLMPKKLIDKSQAYFWTKKWQDAEKEADEDIRAGRTKTFSSVAELLEDLDEE